MGPNEGDIVKKYTGFTLVELLVVIAIIAVLLAILLPSIATVKEVANRVRCGSNFKGLGMGFKFYADTYDGKLPQLEYNTGTKYETQQHPYWAFRDGTTGGPWKTAINFGCLYRGGLVENISTFYCPADNRWKDSMKAYATAGAWGEKVPTFPVNDPLITTAGADAVCLRLNIAYWPQAKYRMDQARCNAVQRIELYEAGYPDIPYKFVDLDSNKAYSSDNGGHALGGSVIEGERSKGQNALFGDGHVIFGAPPTDNEGLQYRIRQEMENTGIIDGVSNRTNRYFYYLQP